MAWGCNLYADLIGHWEKRKGNRIDAYNPENIDRQLYLDLFRNLVTRVGSHQLVDLALHRRSLEKVGIHIGPQMDRIHEDEITEVLISNQALLEFMRLPSPR